LIIIFKILSLMNTYQPTFFIFTPSKRKVFSNNF